jgi:hypothetical protein
LEDQLVILVIEDDQQIRSIVEDALTDGGFEPALTASGHGDQWASQGVPNSILLTKPFAPAQLVTAISQLLNTGPPTT